MSWPNELIDISWRFISQYRVITMIINDVYRIDENLKKISAVQRC